MEDLLRNFFKNSPNAYSILKIIFNDQGIPYDYELLEINEAYENLMCVKASDVIGKRTSIIYQSVNRQDYAKWCEIIQDSIVNNKITRMDAPHHSIDKWLRLIVYPLDRYHLASIIYDVTKEYIQEKEIEGFLNFNLDILCVSDSYFNIYRVNKKFENVLGYKNHELEGEYLLMLVHEDDMSSTLNEVKKLKEQKSIKNFVNRYRCKDGSYRFFQWYCETYGNYIFSSARDVTEQHKLNKELFIKTQSELVTSIIEKLDLGFSRISYPELTLIALNNKSYNLFEQLNPNVDLQSALGQSIFSFNNIINKEMSKKDIQKLVEKYNGPFYTYINIILNGGHKFFKYLIQPLFDIDNRIIELICITIDITKEIAEKNKIEESLKIQEEVFANISHEIKTPLNVIFSANQLLNLQLKNVTSIENKEKLYKGINAIKQNCYRLIKLVNNIIDISKLNAGYLELNLTNENIVSIVENIVQSVSEYAKGKGLNIIFDTNTEEKIIACDTLKIERIILNLISNAIKFSNSNGEIFVSLNDIGDSVEISVKDTGIGIDKKQLHEIFKRFKQVDKSLSRNAEGSGIGLALVKSLVDLHSGKISVESKVGRGSIFKVELPCKTVEEFNNIEKSNDWNNKIEMIKIEFSDIYSL